MSSEITDIRKKKEFSGVTFSKFKKSEAKKELLNMIKNNLIESACYWSGEFICAGHYLDLWEIIIKVMGNNIHLGNPKLPLYINKRLNEFRDIIQSYNENELEMRNNKRIRNIFCEIICILSLSQKKTTFDIQKINESQYNITNLKSHLTAPSVNYGRAAFTSNDPNELFIAANELAWNIRNKNSYKAFFWIEWIIGFEDMCKKKKTILKCKNRNVPVPDKNRSDVIFLVWDIILQECKKHIDKSDIITSLLNIFCVRYTDSVRKKRRFLIYFAISVLCEPVNLNTQIISKSNIVKSALNNIDKIYLEIKKNECSPKTAYLFQNIKDKSKNLKKIQGMDTFTNIIIRN